MEIKKLISFDFDDTLVHTTLPAEGKQIWKEKTGEEWPYRAWWSRPESLDMDVFDIPLNKKIYRRYKQAISDPDNYVILATGRVAPLQDEVDIILNHYGLEFDEMHLNPGIDTFEFKSNLFAKLIYELQPEEFIMYDDRQEHLVKFVQWANAMPCKVTIIDAISGEEFKPNEDKNLQENIRKVLMEMVNESKGWGDSKQKLERTFKFKDFNGSIDFVNKVAKIAESQNHHPDIEINYNKVKISITDHEKGGVSEKCHKLVKSIDKL
jgi:4a-hydroxytetrahydrobiopterin dehydratase